MRNFFSLEQKRPFPFIFQREGRPSQIRKWKCNAKRKRRRLKILGEIGIKSALSPLIILKFNLKGGIYPCLLMVECEMRFKIWNKRREAKFGNEMVIGHEILAELMKPFRIILHFGEMEIQNFPPRPSYIFH